MLKNFLMKKLIKSKMKDVPEAEQEKVIALLQKNPELFQKIAAEAQEKMKEGGDQMTAVMSVMQKYEKELREIM